MIYLINSLREVQVCDIKLSLATKDGCQPVQRIQQVGYTSDFF